ncbi:two-component system chemotaxis response regulator CheB [Kineococcus radiotolerans]|uniref:Protein-glutamate methylesterase/protein-glutamine glutaminase n=1 Tax=Kineococcus radiotolerans TaxID=131568 RepID=A0A7W4TJ74_KINRA|nr:chemotaxis-specific protein-glutamate methyltransferase CheB [Kineococcus radiotolerans]MBB2899548.1 two-component system chemotaxis response regulator CheB [Kineococcus radiotolerans]
MAGPNLKVLVVDDSALMRKALKTMLTADGDVEVVLARNGEDALDVLSREEPDVVTLDVNMPVMDGLTCLSRIMAEHPVPVVMVSSITEQGAVTTLEALELGAVDYVAKPGGTVSLNLSEAAEEIRRKVRRAAGSRVRPGSLTARLRRQREEAHAAARAGRTPRTRAVPVAGGGTRPAGAPGSGTTDLVLVGSSTGGPALLSALLSQFPADFAAPVVIAQHMPASFTGALAHRLDASCPLAVQEVTGLVPVLPGHVYVARGDADVVLGRRGGDLVVRPAPAGAAHRWHPSVDRMVASAMEHVDPARTVGVLLTGMGDDGAEQMAQLKARGGRTVAESEETAVVWGMPGQLVARDGATRVLPADQIAAQVIAWG